MHFRIITSFLEIQNRRQLKIIMEYSHVRFVTQQTVSTWFAKFRSLNADSTNDQSVRPVARNNDEPKATIVSDTFQSVRELRMFFGVMEKTILTHLPQIGTMENSDKWVPHQLNGNQKQQYLEGHTILLSSHKIEPFLHRIVNGRRNECNSSTVNSTLV